MNLELESRLKLQLISIGSRRLSATVPNIIHWKHPLVRQNFLRQNFNNQMDLISIILLKASTIRGAEGLALYKYVYVVRSTYYSHGAKFLHKGVRYPITDSKLSSSMNMQWNERYKIWDSLSIHSNQVGNK